MENDLVRLMRAETKMTNALLQIALMLPLCAAIANWQMFRQVSTPVRG